MSSGEEAKSCEHIVVGKLGRWFRGAAPPPASPITPPPAPVPVKTAGRWLPVEDIFSSLNNVWEEAERCLPPPRPSHPSPCQGLSFYLFLPFYLSTSFYPLFGLWPCLV